MDDKKMDRISINFIRLHDHAAQIEPASPRRAWMDATDQRFAYRCMPILIANASGWDFTCPFAFELEWDGTTGRDAISVSSAAERGLIETFIASHFGHGIVTFHTGWLVRTDAGWATWARGSPNDMRDGIAALEGIVETDWLPFPFTMNWRFTRPGKVRFEEGDPFCFVMPMDHSALDHIQPVISDLGDDPDLAEAYRAWSVSRATFNTGLENNDPEAMRAKWQKNYARAEHPLFSPHAHITKRALARPARKE